jgi:hypothetical protein
MLTEKDVLDPLRCHLITIAPVVLWGLEAFGRL